MRRRLTVGFTAVALLAAGCAAGGDSDGPEQESGAAELEFWLTGTDTDKAIVESAAEQFTAENPDITVKVQTLDWEDGYAKVLAATTSKSGPDIVSGGLGWAKEFGELGGMADLTQFGVTDGISEQVDPRFYDPLVSADDKVYGVPLSLGPHLFYYQTDVLAKAGITQPPTTWQELSDANAALKAAGVATPFAVSFGNLSWLSYFNYVYQAGGAPYAPDCSEVTLDSPESVQALQYWSSLYTQGGAPTDNVDAPTGFAEGTIGMNANGSWMINVWEAAKPELAGKWGVSTLPAGPAGSVTTLGGQIVGVMSFSEHQQQAADFIEYLYTDEAITTMSETAASNGALWLSPRPDLLDSLGLPAEQTQVLESAFETAVIPPICDGWEDVQGDVDKMLQTVVYEGADPAAVVAEIDTMMTGALEASS